VNRIKSIQSTYRWQGQVEQSEEELLIIKTRRELFTAVKKGCASCTAIRSRRLSRCRSSPAARDISNGFRKQTSAGAPLKEDSIRTIKEISAGGVIYRKTGDDIEICPDPHAQSLGTAERTCRGAGEREQAALREVREETGLEGKLIRKLGRHRLLLPREREGHEPVRIYKAGPLLLLRYLRGDMRDHDHEADDVRWFPIEQRSSNSSLQPSAKWYIARGRCWQRGRDNIVLPTPREIRENRVWIFNPLVFVLSRVRWI